MKASSDENYSTRCLISHRPDFMTEEPVFYRCPDCGETIIAARTKEADRSRHAPVRISCCDGKKPLDPLPICTDPVLNKEHQIKFVIYGGYEYNAIRIEVDGGYHPMENDHRIEWIYLRTFQGGQFKYLPKSGRSLVNFSFADFDAFVYCDREICRMGREHCQFLCKRGMVIYAYCSRHGLFRMELDGEPKMTCDPK